jgi:hypothetical protein
LRPPVIEGHTHLTPRINVFSDIACQDVTLPDRERSLLRLGKQTEPLRRNADSVCDLPKTPNVPDLASA